MEELQRHLSTAGVFDPRETAEVLYGQHITWSLLVDTFLRTGDGGGRAGVGELLDNNVKVGARFAILNYLTDTQQSDASPR